MSFLTKGFATYEADGVIAKGSAVKFGTTNKRVAVAAGTTDDVIGIAQNATVNAGDLCEVVLFGGAKALAKASIVKGTRLGCNADGSIQKVASQGDTEFAVALDDASAGDIFAVMVRPQTKAYSSQA